MNITVEELIKQGENLQVEFKSDKKHLSDEAIVAAVVCLANREGGYLLIGVEDNGIITGAHPYPRHGHNIDIVQLRAMIYSKTRPHIWVESWVEYIENKPVIIVKVPPTSLSCTSSGKYLWRIIGGDGKPACVPMEPYEIISKVSDLPEKDFSAKLLPLKVDALEAESIRKLYAMLPDNMKTLPEREVFQILGITNHTGNLTVAGLLLCGRENIIREVIPYHEVVFNVFKGDKLISQDTWHKNIISIWYYLNEKFQVYNIGIDEIIKNGNRYEIPLIDIEVWRESLANAIVHRSFTQPNAVSIIWYTDGRIEIQNPGGLVKGVNINNILSTPPTPRNPLLAEIFRKLGLVEKTGRGIDKIYKYQAIYGKPLPVWDISDTYVKLIIIGNDYNKDFFFLIAGLELLPEEVLLLYARQLLHIEDENELSTFIQKTIPETRYFIKRLKEQGLWKPYFNHPLQASVISDKEENVLRLFKTHKELSRKDIVSLLKMSPATASRILSSLTEKGLLARKGKGPSTKYYLPQ